MISDFGMVKSSFSLVVQEEMFIRKLGWTFWAREIDGSIFMDPKGDEVSTEEYIEERDKQEK